VKLSDVKGRNSEEAIFNAGKEAMAVAGSRHCVEPFPGARAGTAAGIRSRSKQRSQRGLRASDSTGYFSRRRPPPGEKSGRQRHKNRVPVTLELVVGEGAGPGIAAKRIAFGKLAGAGQICVAPD
jgi:hypothetical protein